MDPRGPLDGGVMVVRSAQQVEDANFSTSKIQFETPLPIQKLDMDPKQEQNAHLQENPEAVRNERGVSHERIDIVLNDLIAVQIELEEEKQASMVKDVQINQLQEEILRLSERLDKGSHGISELKPDNDELKVLPNENPPTHRLEMPTNNTAVMENNTANMQHDMRAELGAKGTESQDASKTTAELEFQHQSDVSKLQEQVNQAQTKCLENQRRWEIAEAKVEALREAAQLQASQADDVADMEGLLEFYQNNAEGVSKRAKETMAANKELEALLMAKDKQLDEQASLIMTMRRPTDNQEADTQQPMIPGSFC